MIIKKDLQIFLSDEYKLVFSKRRLGKMDKTGLLSLIGISFLFFFSSFLSFIFREIVETMHW